MKINKGMRNGGHINVYGKYHFNLDEVRRRQGLRPLRQPGRMAS
jgi:hypothetical protein